jgi:hypothetical protein
MAVSARSSVYSRHQPGGVFLLTDEARYSGEVFFVDSTNASASNVTGGGKNPDAPLASIAYALTLCTAGQGDVIIVHPNHAEPVLTAAGTLTVSVNDVTILGQAVGQRRPKITFSTATTASFLISGSGVRISNLYFDCTGFDALANPVNVTGPDCEITDCSFLLANSTNQAVCGVNASAAANRLKIERCRFLGSSDAGCTAAVVLTGGDGAQVVDCFMQGAYSSGVGGIQNVTTACTNTLVKGNTINNLTASNTKAMVFVSGSTGVIRDNRMQILSGTAPITGAAMSWVGGNYYAAGIATGGTLI